MTVEEVSEQVQLPVVGLMPKLQKKGFQFELDGKDTLEVQRVTTRIMKHLPAGNLQIDKFPADKQRTLLITSSIDTEGKSTFAAHLAANLAAFQKWPVLLIDADLRRPEQHRLFKVDNQSGLMNLLEDNNAVSALLASTQYENLSVLPSGRLQGTPLELFTSKRFASALAELKKEFAFIIIDAPPVIPVNDTLLLSRHANSILYMVKAGVTPRNIVKRGVDLLVNAGGSNLGIVLNNLKQVLPYYYQPNYLSANGSVKRSS
jgi:capsular exopolysaccharide synthesis family protein